MKTSNWIATITGILALIISAVTAYFTVLRQTDGLKVVVGSIPEVSVDWSKGELTLSGAQTFTLINSGTRTAALIGVDVLIRQMPGETSEYCPPYPRSLGELRAEVKIKPFVIRPGEIIVIEGPLRKDLQDSTKPLVLKLTTPQYP